MAVGWIKIHRKLQDCFIWTDSEPFDRRSAWLDLLLQSEHKEKRLLIKGKTVIITRGQRFTSTLKLAERWHWSVNRVRRFLALLEEQQMITTERNKDGIILTIVNYGLYQDEQTTDGITYETTNETTDGIADETADGIQIKNIKNKRSKEVKNIKEKYIKEKPVYYPNDEALDKAFTDYVVMRKQIKKPLTDRAIELAMKKLDELSNGDNDLAIRIIEQSVLHSWQGLFPISENLNKKNMSFFDAMAKA